MQQKKMRANHCESLLLFLCLATLIASTTPHKHNQIPYKMKHFILVHGAGHGAWCWYKVATLLTAAGHNVTAADLAGSGVDPTQLRKVNSIEDYSEPLIKLMDSLAPQGRVIIVAHSLGGLPLSLVMERFPSQIAAAVFVTADMPGPNLSLATISKEFGKDTDFMDTRYRFDDGASSATAVFFGPKFLASKLYQQSPQEDLTLALALVRWAPIFHEELELTMEKYGSVPRVFIMTEQDPSLNLQSLMITQNPPNEVKVINGSDHMVMFSRPLELFSSLLQIAQKHCQV